MNTFADRIARLSPQKLALLASELYSRLELFESARFQPVAILGAGCRFPGGCDTPESYWQFLLNRGDGVGEIPSERWSVDAFFDPDPDAPGKSYSRRGAFVSGLADFDAEFFGISPREARSMDPQQRLLLETSWEALERACIVPEALRGTDAGVFFGLSTSDYRQLMVRGTSLDCHSATGTSHSVAAGRLSYFLGTHGPSMAIDTACSSSLTAVHLACRSIQAGDCSLALAGGVNAMLTPEATIALSRTRMLSPDGRCKTFDDSADGFVRGEGCGVVVLKKLCDALADRDPIQCVILSSAINQDGRSNGLTAPNGAAQSALIGRALASAGLRGSDIGYVESHGTGTSLGDPIEIHALISALGEGRTSDNPLRLGSVKSNIGHLEAAAGVAGLIKAALTVKEGVIAPALHFQRWNRHIDFRDTPVLLPRERCRWEARKGARLAGVSSFGFSGTNVFLILGEAPEREPECSETAGAYSLVLSARTDRALRDLARKYKEYLDTHPDVSLQDFCHTVASSRTAFAVQTAVSGRSRDELSAALTGIATRTSQGGPAGAARTSISGNRIEVPTYAFQRQPYWASVVSAPMAKPGPSQPQFSRLTWISAPMAVAAGRSLDDIARSALEGTPELAAVVAQYEELRPLLDRLVVQYIATALQELGMEFRQGAYYPATYLPTRMNPPDSRHQLDRLLAVLGEEGSLRAESGGWRVLRIPEALSADSLASEISGLFPDFAGELEMTNRCGKALAGVLNGEIRILDLLFPAGSLEAVEKIYENSTAARQVQQLVALAARKFATSGQTRTVRILEIGAGSGGTTTYVAKAVEDIAGVYCFTDISQMFTNRARKKYARYPFFQFRCLDIEKSPGAQGFEGEKFDIVIASNVLHATRNLRSTLIHVRELMAPSACLLLLEATRTERWVDITFGMTDGWWQFSDEYRHGQSPLVDAAGWKQALADAGFAAVVATPGGSASPQLLLASRETSDSALHRAWQTIPATGGIAETFSGKVPRSEPSVAPPACSSDRSDARDVLFLAALDLPPINLSIEQFEQSQKRCCGSLLETVQRLIRIPAEQPRRLWIVTRGSQEAGSADRVRNPEQATVWGLGRSIALEHPEIWGGLIDLDPDRTVAEQRDLILRQLESQDGDDQVAFRGNQRFVPRIVPEPAPENRVLCLDPQATYLITGGLGVLGLKVARWLVSRGATRLLLCGRHGVESAQQTAAIRELTGAGADVEVVPMDVRSLQSVSALLRRINLSDHPLAGIIHAAAVFRSESVKEMTLDALWEVVAPKAIGALLIDAGCAAAPLDFCCFFSSITAITGSSGLAHYTAANAFCDALASHRNGSGRRYLSINWGIWEEMHSMTKTNRDRVLLAGLRPMDEAGALDALGSLILSESSQAIVSATDWRLLRAAYEVRRPRPIFAEVNGRPKRPDLPVETPVADCTGKAVRSVAQQAVCEELIRVLDLPADTDLDEDRGFFELGMDSLLSVEFVNHLNDRLQCSLSSSAPFHFPTIRDLAAHIARPAERPETWREPSNPERDNGSGLRADAVVDRLRAALQRS